MSNWKNRLTLHIIKNFCLLDFPPITFFSISYLPQCFFLLSLYARFPLFAQFFFWIFNIQSSNFQRHIILSSYTVCLHIQRGDLYDNLQTTGEKKFVYSANTKYLLQICFVYMVASLCAHYICKSKPNPFLNNDVTQLMVGCDDA